MGRGGRRSGSLYQGPAPRPGPDILYRPPAQAPQLENGGIWRAEADPDLRRERLPRRASSSTRTSSTTTTAPAAQSATRAILAPGSDTFSRPNGTYTYPTNPVYANNAADLVELRVKPLANATAFRITLNTLKDPASVATTIAIGGSAAAPPLPPRGQRDRTGGALPHRPRPAGGPRARQRLEADQAGAAGVDRRAAPPDPGPRLPPRLGPGPAHGSPRRRRRALEQGGRPVSRARRRRHRHPAPAAPPGSPVPTAFFNAAFRFREPWQHTFPPDTVFSDPAWWRDRQQGNALAGKRPRARSTPRSTSPSSRPGSRTTCAASPAACRAPAPWTGSSPAISRPSRAPTTRVDLRQPNDCQGELRGRLQPYAIYVPKDARSAGRLRPDPAAPLARRATTTSSATAATSRSSASGVRGRS